MISVWLAASLLYRGWAAMLAENSTHWGAGRDESVYRAGWTLAGSAALLGMRAKATPRCLPVFCVCALYSVFYTMRSLHMLPAIATWVHSVSVAAAPDSDTALPTAAILPRAWHLPLCLSSHF